MKNLKSKAFALNQYEILVKFVNNNNIAKEDILAITHDNSMYTLFFIMPKGNYAAMLLLLLSSPNPIFLC